MINDAVRVLTQETPPFSWGPYLAVGLGVTLTAVVAFFQRTSSAVNRLINQVSVLIEHTTNTDSDMTEVKKYHDEIMEHKTALAELNEWKTGITRQVDSVQGRLDNTEPVQPRGQARGRNQDRNTR